MDNPRPEKVATVAEISELLNGADATLMTEYRGMSVKAISDLRRALRPVGGEYKVFKNTLVWKAALATGRDTPELEKLLHGPTAIAFVKGDAVEAAKALREAAKTNPALVVKGGLLGSKVLSASDANALADMPPRVQVLAELAGLFEAPLSQLASLIEAPARDIAYAISALIDKNGGEQAAA